MVLNSQEYKIQYHTNSFHFEGIEVVHIIKPHLKHSYIQIKSDGSLLVKTPRMSEKYVTEFLTSKWRWIEKHLKQQKEQPRIILEDNNLYKQMAHEYLPARVEHFAQLMKLEFNTLRLRKMKSKWGSCSSQRNITLNTQLMQIDKELIDYVIVHELSHLVHMNHSKAFHAYVAKFLPNHKQLRRELKRFLL